VALGPGAARHAVGDRVALEPGIPCGRCGECRAGRYNLCRDVRFFATPPVDGAFADYVAIPRTSRSRCRTPSATRPAR
jgi:L-iditol 2-dehydrogenase